MSKEQAEPVAPLPPDVVDLLRHALWALERATAQHTCTKRISDPCLECFTRERIRALLAKEEVSS